MKPAYTTFWRGVAGGSDRGFPGLLLTAFLSPLSLLYALVQQLRAGLYRIGILQTRRLPRPVISIGNIAVGGTGKTPVTACIARMLMEQGYRVAVLTRGYGGSLEGQTVIASDGDTVMLSARECGDEPFLLASTIPGLIVVIGTDRHAAGLLALQQLAPDLFLLDDGFQHLRLRRDLNILLLDFALPFGNGWTLPSGLLREPKAAAGRADLIIQTRCPAGAFTAPPLSGIPFCNSSHELTDCIPLSGGEPFPLEQLRGKRLLAFAGIAQPQYFFDGLRSRGLNVVATIDLPDHISYVAAHISTISESLERAGADYAITTEKDGVKLNCLPQELADKTLLARLTVTIADPAPLKALLRNLLHK